MTILLIYGNNINTKNFILYYSKSTFITYKPIAEKLKSYCLTVLVKIFKGAGWLYQALKIIFKLPLKLFYYFWRLFLRYPFLLIYKFSRKVKKFTLLFFPLKETEAKKFFGLYGPLLMMMAIGLTIVITNLQAQGVKPENPGQKSLLIKIAKSPGDYWEDEILLEEIKEGPLVAGQTPTSYLEGTALTSKETSIEKRDQGIETLISTTQGESALIAPDITDPEVVTKTRDKIIDYVVQTGDTISTIAAKFGLTTNTILWENNLSYYALIRPGQTLKILPLTGISHKVKKGETLKSLAQKYKGKVEEIITFNKLASASDLKLNEVIIIPGGVKPVAYAPSYTVKTIFLPPAEISDTKLQWPTNSYRLTQYFTWRHSGIDIGNKNGQPVYAAEAGKVTAASWNRGGYGYYIIVDHGGGLKTLYSHLSKINVKLGQNVSRGAVIGAVGSTGRSSGPHLHFEVRVNGVRVNPLGYIR